MEKQHLDRRLHQMEAEGVVFRPKVNVGLDINAQQLLDELRRHLPLWRLDAASRPPDRGTRTRWDPLCDAIPDRPKSAGSRPLDRRLRIHLGRGKHVIIIGGGDTGADCLGTVHRQECKSVHQFEIVPRPKDSREPSNPWPQWSNVFRVSSAHKEGGIREYAINTKKFLGKRGRVRELEAVRVEMKTITAVLEFVEIPDSAMVFAADLVLLAMGFVGPEKKGLLEQLGVELDQAGNVKSDGDKRTSVERCSRRGT